MSKKPIQGLQGSAPQTPGPVFAPGPNFNQGTNDPLGIAAMSAGMANEQNWHAQNPGAFNNTLPDPKWEGWLADVNQAGGGKPINFAGSSGPDLGYDTNNGTVEPGSIETYGPRGLKLTSPNLPLQGLMKQGKF